MSDDVANIPATLTVLENTSSLNIFFLLQKPEPQLYFRSSNGIHRAFDLHLSNVPNFPTRYPTQTTETVCQHEFDEGRIVQTRAGDEMPDIFKTCKLCGFIKINN